MRIDDKPSEKITYPKSCDTCENVGMYTCKKILIDGVCMFYKMDEEIE